MLASLPVTNQAQRLPVAIVACALGLHLAALSLAIHTARQLTHATIMVPRAVPIIFTIPQNRTSPRAPVGTVLPRPGPIPRGVSIAASGFPDSPGNLGVKLPALGSLIGSQPTTPVSNWARTAGGGRAVTGSGDERPRLITDVEPKYPAALEEAGITGTVSVELVVDTSGRVMTGSIAVLEATRPAFATSAVRAIIDQAVFRPGRRAGRKVATRIRMAVRFARN